MSDPVIGSVEYAQMREVSACDIPYDWAGLTERYPVLVGNQPGQPQPEIIAPRLSDEDVERIARRVVELMREAK